MEQNTTTPTRAYDLLEQYERQQVDEYVNYAVQQQHHKRQRIALALHNPIPSEYVRRSKGVLSKPLARAAVAERLQAHADEQDISPSRIIAEHAAIAFSNIADYMNVQPFGDFSVKPLHEIPRAALAAVKKLESIPSPYGIRTSITLHDKHASLKILTELVGLVAPDRPPPLADYAKPVTTQDAQSQVPEAAYVALLESGACQT